MVKLVTGINPYILVDLAKPDINMAEQWSKDDGLVFSLKKTQVILFDRRSKLRVKGKLYINGSKLPFSDEVSYLGLTQTRGLIRTHMLQRR